MGELSEFSLSVRTFLRAYPWRRVEPVPWQPLQKPISRSRVALVSSAGFVQWDQTPFNKNQRGGDYSFRKISSEATVGSLIDTHRSDTYDHSGLRTDPNLAFPLERMRELRDSGWIGSLASHHISFMGSITSPGKLIRDTAPEAALELVEDRVDLAILVPV